MKDGGIDFYAIFTLVLRESFAVEILWCKLEAISFTFHNSTYGIPWKNSGLVFTIRWKEKNGILQPLRVK